MSFLVDLLTGVPRESMALAQIHRDHRSMGVHDRQECVDHATQLNCWRRVPRNDLFEQLDEFLCLVSMQLAQELPLGVRVMI